MAFDCREIKELLTHLFILDFLQRKLRSYNLKTTDHDFDASLHNSERILVDLFYLNIL